MRYDYKVVPAPERGLKARGVKSAEARFAFALEQVMNDLAGEGWEYQRAETLPSEERQGLSGKQVVYRNLLVFRRAREDEVEAYEPRLLDPPKEIPVLDAARVARADRTPVMTRDAKTRDEKAGDEKPGNEKPGDEEPGDATTDDTSTDEKDPAGAPATTPRDA